MNRRQVLLGSSAMVAAAALPAAMVEQGIMPFPDPSPSMIETYKIIWDAKAEVMRMTYIPPEMLYAHTTTDPGHEAYGTERDPRGNP